MPSRTLLAALLLTLLSIGMFFVLIDRTSTGLRVASVVQELDLASVLPKIGHPVVDREAVLPRARGQP